MTDRPPLSPAAQAVWDAAVRAEPGQTISAALRAAADQVVPPALEEEFRDRNQAPPLTAMVKIRADFLAIVAELEAS